MGEGTGGSLADKEMMAAEIIRRYRQGTQSTVVCFSGGKKSTVLLHLAMQNGAGPLTVIRVDTALDFDNIGRYCEKMRKLWGLDLVEVRPESVDSKAVNAGPECCKKLIREPLKKAVADRRVACAFMGTTHESRSKFTLDIARGEDCTRFVYPILHFTEEDIGEYIKKYNLPCCSLYGQGYVNVDCKTCTAVIAVKAMDKGEEETIKEKLRKLGYL